MAEPEHFIICIYGKLKANYIGASMHCLKKCILIIPVIPELFSHLLGKRIVLPVCCHNALFSCEYSISFLLTPERWNEQRNTE